MAPCLSDKLKKNGHFALAAEAELMERKLAEAEANNAKAALAHGAAIQRHDAVVAALQQELSVTRRAVVGAYDAVKAAAAAITGQESRP